MFASFELFGKQISMYAVAALIGMFAAGIYACRETKKRGCDDNDMIVTLLIAAIGVFLGGHILYGITNYKSMSLLFSASSLKEFIVTVVSLFGGSVFYGGLLGGILAGYIYIRKKKLDCALFTDILAPTVPLFHFFGRIGCFLGGCCYGIECEYGFTTTHSLVPLGDGVQRFPVQLLESSLNLILFIILAQLLRRGKFKGNLFKIYLLSYSVIRFFDEFLRGDYYRGFVFGLSTSQLISILIFAGVLISIIVEKIKIKVQA